jgi:hypothetical protein
MTAVEFATCLMPVGPVSPALVKVFIMACVAFYEWGFGWFIMACAAFYE